MRSGLWMLALTAALVISMTSEGAMTAALLLLVAWISGVGISPRPVKLRLTTFDLLLIAFLATLAVGLAWSRAPYLSGYYFWSFALFPLAYWTWSHNRLIGLKGDYFQFAMSVMAAAIALWGVLQSPTNLLTGKPEGPFTDPNLYAGVLNLLGLPLLAAYLAPRSPTQTSMRSYVLVAVMTMVAFSFFLAASRGATLSWLLLAPSIVYAARYQPGIWGRLFTVAFIWLFAYFTLIQLLNHDVVTRLTNTISSGDQSRLQLFRATWRMILEAPLTGTGLGTFHLIYPTYREAAENGSAGLWAHNDYLQIWQEGGIFVISSFALCMLFIVRLFFVSLRYPAASHPVDVSKIQAVGFLAGILAISLQAAVNFIFYSPLVMIMLGLCSAQAEKLISNNDGQLSGRDVVFPRLIAWLPTAVGSIAVFQLVSHMAIHYTLGCDKAGLRILHTLNVPITTYEAAVIASSIRPSAELPYWIMTREIARSLREEQHKPEMRTRLFNEGLASFHILHSKTYCNTRYALEEIDFIREFAQSTRHPDSSLAIRNIALHNFGCNQRHASTIYVLAHEALITNPEEAERWLAYGANRVRFNTERLLFRAAQLHMRAKREGLTILALERSIDQMARMVRYTEEHPAIRPDPRFWATAFEGYLRALNTYTKNPSRYNDPVTVATRARRVAAR